MSTTYRSDHFESGAARRLGSVHFHVDCANSRDDASDLLELAHACEEIGWPAKITRVAVAQPGEHLRDPEFAQEYQQHTPELAAGHSTFSAYLTVLLPKCDDGESAAKSVSKVKTFISRNTSALSGSDTVVEIERVGAIVDRGGITVAEPGQLDVEDDPAYSLYEVHHFVDFPAGSDVPFSEWTRCRHQSRVSVGGWFMFDKGKSMRSFRSVRFARTIALFDLVKETRAVDAAARSFSEEAIVSTIVEQLLGIWRV